MFRRVLIANRGEIAVRIARTLRDMGITSIAVYSDADRDALFAQTADEAYHLGGSAPAESYLNIDAILTCARQSGAEAIHPGYGFLAENAQFARAVREAGLTFIGPTPEAMRLMGDKVRARASVQAMGVPLVPGTAGPIDTVSEALAFGDAAGYPVAVKAAAGGGGRGIRVVRAPDEMASALEGAHREAEAYFKNPDVYLERYFHDPRHIEIQVLGDCAGKVVHLGERDCSTQRRHQKLIEETPSPAVDRALRIQMGEMAVRAAKSAGYTSAGTVEFLLTRDGEFYFLEMNTRIQVEHPITEQVTGVDLIREMLLIAAGEPMSVSDDVLDPHGHSIEVRINAEDPAAGFRPTPTMISEYRQPGGIGVRVDSGVYQGYTVPGEYDSLIAKLVTWGPDRETARRRSLRALDEYRIEGPTTTIPFSSAVLSDPAFIHGEIGTAFVEANLGRLCALMPPSSARRSVDRLAVAFADERNFQVEVNRKLFTVRVAEQRTERPEIRRRIGRARELTPRSNALLSPMHGTVIAMKKVKGDTVREGEPLVIVEAMKMENEAVAHRAGTLTAVNVSVGDTVEADQILLTIE